MSDQPTDEQHHYVSTACQHELCGSCRKTCKFCPAACACVCHEQTPGGQPTGKTVHHPDRTTRENAWRQLCEINAEMTREDITADQAADLRDQIAEALYNQSLDAAGGKPSFKLDDRTELILSSNSLSRADAVMPIVQADRQQSLEEIAELAAELADERTLHNASIKLARRRLAKIQRLEVELVGVRSQIDRVRRRHRQAEASPLCHGCGFTWPCQTLRDLEQPEAS